MLSAMAMIGLSTLLGLLMGQTAIKFRGAMGPLKSFALAASLWVVFGHLLPEAMESLGFYAPLLMVASLFLPALSMRLFRRGRQSISDREPELALAWAFWGLCIHKFGDGLALGAIASEEHHLGHSHIDAMIAISAHTPPVLAAMFLSYAQRFSLKKGIQRVLLLGAFFAVGVLAGQYGVSSLPSAWADPTFAVVSAFVCGSLLHIVAHDLQGDKPTTFWHRTSDFIAACFGIALGFINLGGSEHHAHHGSGFDNHLADIASTGSHIASAASASIHDCFAHGSYLAALFELSIEAAPALFIGFLSAAWLQSRNYGFASKLLKSKGRFSDSLKGAVVGIPVPLCSCGVVPVASALRRKGASASLVGAFLVATPELGPDSLILTVGLMGWNVGLFRLLASLFVALSVGLFIWDRNDLNRKGEKEIKSCCGTAKEADSAEKEPSVSFFAALDEIVLHLGAWVVVGLLAAAAISNAGSDLPLPTDSALPIQILWVMVVSMPGYVCASSSTPLAAALIAKGLHPAAALSGLILGPATNLTTWGFLKSAFGSRIALRFVLGIALSTFVFCYLAAPWLKIPEVLLTGEHEHSSWYGYLFLLLTLLLLAGNIFRHGFRTWLSSISWFAPEVSNTARRVAGVQLADESHGHSHSHGSHGHSHGHNHSHGHQAHSSPIKQPQPHSPGSHKSGLGVKTVIISKASSRSRPPIKLD